MNAFFIFKSILLAGLVMLRISGYVYAGENLFPNPSFEEVNDKQFPTGGWWFSLVNPIEKGTDFFSMSDFNFKSGKKSLRVEINKDNMQYATESYNARFVQLSIYPPIEKIKGHNVRVKMYYLVEEPIGILSMELRTWNKDKQPLEYIKDMGITPIKGNWQETIIEGYIPEEAAIADCNIGIRAKEEVLNEGKKFVVYIDDVGLEIVK